MLQFHRSMVLIPQTQMCRIVCVSCVHNMLIVYVCMPADHSNMQRMAHLQPLHQRLVILLSKEVQVLTAVLQNVLQAVLQIRLHSMTTGFVS